MRLQSALILILFAASMMSSTEPDEITAALNDMAACINFSLKPCENFYDFVCSNQPFNQTSLSRQVINKAVNGARLFVANPVSPIPELNQLVSDFYVSCTQHGKFTTRERQLEAFENIVGTFGVVPQNITPAEVALKLSLPYKPYTVDAGTARSIFHLFFKIIVKGVAVDIDLDFSKLELFSQEPNNPKRFANISKTLALLTHPNKPDDQLMRKVITVEEKLFSFTNNRINDTKKLKFYPKTGSFGIDSKPLAVDKAYPYFYKFVQTLIMYLPDKINLIRFSWPHTVAFINSLNDPDMNDNNHFMIQWAFANVYHRYFFAELHKDFWASSQIFSFCQREIQQHADTLVNIMYFNNFFHNNPGLETTLEDVLSKLHNFTADQIEQSAILNTGGPKEAVRLANSIRAVKHTFGVNKSVSTPEQLKKIYANITFRDKNDYLQNMIDCWRQINVRDSQLELGYPLFSPNGIYDTMFDTLVIASVIGTPPYYLYKGPDWFNYATYSSIAIHELMHHFFSITSKPFRGMENNVSKSISEGIYCFDEQYNKTLSRSLSSDITAERAENLADASGYPILHSFFQKYHTPAQNCSQMPDVLQQFTNEQLFFMASCYAHCKSEGEGESHHGNARQRCQVPLKNVPAFGKAFNCPLGSDMNPINKCRLLVFWIE